MEKWVQFLKTEKKWERLVEKTIEVNPESFDEEKASLYQQLGFNRISIGIQSFDNAILCKIGRLSNASQNIKAVEIAQKYFSNFSLDFIYGIPRQNLGRELSQFLSFHPPHLSCYNLTIEEGTPLYCQKSLFQKNDLALNRIFLEIHEKLEENGYRHYEISNFAKDNLSSRHNSNYWKRGSYLGLGAGAAGYLSDVRYQNETLDTYRELLEKKEKPCLETEFIDAQKILVEDLMLGLRTAEGISSNIAMHEDLKPNFERFFAAGWLQAEKNKIHCTLKGWIMLDLMIKEFFNCLK